MCIRDGVEVVERHVRTSRPHLLGAIGPVQMGGQHNPPLQGEMIVLQAIPEAVRACPEGEQTPLMGEEAEMAPHVEAQARPPVGRELASGTQHGAVASQLPREIQELGVGG